MKLVCPACGRTIAGSDIDLGKGLGLCRPCGELVPFGGAQRASFALEGAAQALYRPESMRLVEQVDGGRYEATLRPNRLAALPMLGFCAMWDTFMAVWYGIAISGGIWPMALFGLLHLGAGVVLTHTALVAFFNTRRLVLEGRTLTWKSGPIPTFGNVTLPVDAVDGFAPQIKEGRKSTSYVVAMNLSSGTTRELDVDAADFAGAEYAAASFAKALLEAKRIEGDQGPYRG